MKKELTLCGNFRTDYFGNIIVDNCESDQEHLTKAPTAPVSNRPVCRRSFNRLFDEVVGKHGILTISFTFEEG